MATRAPAAEPGACDGLWEHEVVELFLLGTRERYLEIELGPHGHHWVLQLEGVRNVRCLAEPIAYASRIYGARWAAEARLGREWLPDPLIGANAYAIHGPGGRRRHLAWQAVPGERPDFHRLQYFAALSIEQLERH